MIELLAPNGKPSNLSPEQYELVRTSAFKEWFGDWEKLVLTKLNDSGIDEVSLKRLEDGVSKVVDENGEPLLVYHSSKRKFNIFEKEKISENFEYSFGFHFSNNIEDSKKYGKITKSFFLKITNPFVFNVKDKSNGSVFIDINRYDAIHEIIKSRKTEKEIDGVIAYSSINGYVTMYSNQIKLADGTNTTFDGNNPDIRFNEGGSTLLAPNGKPSNLTPEQYKLVRTPEFKAWFGDWENDPENSSEVVDEETKEPLVVWHGSKSNENFNVFKQSSRFEFIYFAKIKEYAWFHFTKDIIDKPFQLRPFFLNIRNLLNAEEYGFEKVDFSELKSFFYGIHELSKDIQLNPKSQYRFWEVLRFSNDIYNSLKNQDYYDGISFYENFYDNTTWNDTDDYSLSYVVMNPNQIKLADGTNTTFDVNNPDIRFVDGGGIDENEPLVVSNYILNRHPIKGDVFQGGKVNGYKIVKFKKFKKHYGIIYEILLIDTKANTGGNFNKRIVGYTPQTKKISDFNQSFLTATKGKYYTIWSDSEIDEKFKKGGKVDSFGKVEEIIINPTEIECHSCHWKWKVKDGGDDLFICHKCNYDNSKFYKFEGLEGQKILDTISYAKGGRTISQTIAPKEERIYGSDKNKDGSSKDLTSAKKIELSDSTIEAIKNKVDEHNEKHANKKITIDSAKAVVRRGMGTYSSSHRPTISNGKPNSRVAWGLARLNAFLYKIINGKSKSGKYNQDDDLIKELGYKVEKYSDGGSVLLAPNGKPSNLTPEQYKLVRSLEFKAWFGDWEKLILTKLNDSGIDEVSLKRLEDNVSKVVDSNGEPLVVLHGTKSFDIYEFELSKSQRKSSGLKEFGTYFTDNKTLAEAYRNWSELKPEVEKEIDIQIQKWDEIQDKSRNNRDYENAEKQIKLLKESKRGKIYNVFLNLKKVKVFDAEGNINIEAWNNLKVKASYKTAINRDAMEFLKEGKFGVEKVDGIKATNIVDAFVQTEKLKKELLSNVYLVFDSENIKLADGTNTTFDGNNPDIRYDEGGSLDGLIIGNVYSGKKIRDIISNYGSQEGTNMNEFANDYIDLNDNYILGNVNIEKLIQNDVDLKSFISDEYDPNYNVPYSAIKNPILLGDGIYEQWKKNVVLDGYHRVLQALYNKDKKITAFIKSDSADKIISFEQGGLIAPNGKPSNLTPEQYKLVRTPEFKAWFGDWENSPENSSQVIDSNGEPLVVYHGSYFNGNIFKIKYDNNGVGLIYFSNKKIVAEKYGKIREFFLKVQNLDEIDLDYRGFNDAYDNTSLETYLSETEDGLLMLNIYDDPSGKKKGVISNVYAVKYPNQIKLADGTNTTFDENNADIRFEEGGQSINKKETMNKKDTITMDVPLFIRMLELAREDIKSDEQLHQVVENVLDLKDKSLTMDDYNSIIMGTIDNSNKPTESEFDNKVNDLKEHPELLKYFLKHGGQTTEQSNKISKVMHEFNDGKLKTSHGQVVTDPKQAIAIALSEAGIQKEMEEGGIIEGQLHSECNDSDGCGEKFEVGSGGNTIEAERDEAVIVSEAFNNNNTYTIYGTCSQIASALNIIGGGKNFDQGASIMSGDGKQLSFSQMKSEAKNTDVDRNLEGGSIIINRRSMADPKKYTVTGTTRQIASAINSMNNNGVVIEDGAEVK